MVSPDDEEPNHAEFSQAPLEPAESPPDPAELPPEPPTPAPAPVKRKRRSIFSSLLSTLLLLVLLAGGALYAAIAFKDKDERLKLVADYAEPYVGQANVVFEELKNQLTELLGEKATRRTATVPPEAPPAQPLEPAQITPARPAETAAEPTPPTTAPPEAPLAPPSQSAQVTPAKPAETATEPTPSERRRESVANAAGEAQNAAIDAQNAAVAALQSRVASAEDVAQRALRAAEAAEAAANSIKATAEAAADSAKAAAEAAAKAGAAATAAPSEQGERSGLSASDQLAALEGRIDELGGEVKALRERLDSPKSETRAAPEAAPAKVADGSAALVVVAYALQREFEAGRPYAVEARALTRLGADPAALAALSPLAEKGAPTAAQLKADFATAAKRIRALEGGDSGDLAQHLMKGASKLVRVRPSGAPTGEAETVDEKVAQIDAALAHGDLARAAALFAALPEAARSEAKDFGAALRARIDAGRAAENLLHGAIDALGATKE